ncbi:MAG: sulfotransferase domain-containing protein [Pseudomonadota bacterium]
MTLLPDRLTHGALVATTAPLPKPLRVKARSKLLADFQLAKARRSDILVIVHPKSGGTWFRVMLSRLYQKKYGLPPERPVKSDEFHNLNGELPRFLFTNGHYMYEDAVRRLFDEAGTTGALDDKKVVFLARHPCDIAVSWYLQVTKRLNPYNWEMINNKLVQPIERSEISMWDFVMHEEMGLPALIDYLNTWEKAVSSAPHGLVVRYEDFRSRPEASLKLVSDFTGRPFSDEEIAEAVEFASFNNMKKLEKSNFFRNKGLKVKNPSDPDAYKVRRGKVEGYRDYFEPEQLARMDELVRTRMSPTLGYGQESAGLDKVAESG